MRDVDAARIVREAWRRVHHRDASANELLFALAIAKLETGYGRAGQHGELAARGLFNWGNLEVAPLEDGTCPPGHALGRDVDAFGNPKNVCFVVASSDVEAAARFVAVLTRKHWPVIAAMRTGSAGAVAHAMKLAPAYYEAPEAAYAAALQSISTSIRRSLLGERGGAWDATIVLAAVAAVAWFALRDAK